MGTEQQRDGRRPGSYYTVLGVRPDASLGEIRGAYRKLAMRWHPDRRGREPWIMEEAKRRFQQIQEAYHVLSDEKRRALYDAGLYDPLEDDDDEVEGFHDFVQEMVTLMSTVRREEKQYSLEELQRMLAEMVDGFASPPPQPSSSVWFDGGGGAPKSTKRSRDDTDRVANARSRFHASGLQVFGSAGIA